MKNSLAVLILCSATSDVSAQDQSAVSASVLERLERLERDNHELRQKLERVERQDQPTPESIPPAVNESSKHAAPGGWIYSGTKPEAVFTENDAEPILNEDMVRSIVAEEFAMLNEDAGSSDSHELTETQKLENKLAELDKSWKAFEQKANKKTYPSITVNGVFQADAG